MKKAVVVAVFLTVLISLLNFPIYLYYDFNYNSENSIKQDIAEGIEYYQQIDTAEPLRKYYGDDLPDLMNSLLSHEYRVLEKSEALKLMCFSDVAANSRETSMPQKNLKDYSISRLTRLKLFEVEEVLYVCCTYISPSSYVYTVYECSYNEETEQIFERDCFSDDTFNSDKQRLFNNAKTVTVKHFLPVIIAALILFLPTLTEGKRSTDEARKLSRIMAKIGFAAIPVFIVIMYAVIYLR